MFEEIIWNFSSVSCWSCGEGFLELLPALSALWHDHMNGGDYSFIAQPRQRIMSLSETWLHQVHLIVSWFRENDMSTTIYSSFQQGIYTELISLKTNLIVSGFLLYIFCVAVFLCFLVFFVLLDFFLAERIYPWILNFITSDYSEWQALWNNSYKI